MRQPYPFYHLPTQHSDEQQLTLEIIEGYCRELPQEIVFHVIDIFYRFGSLAAMATAKALVAQRKMQKRFG